MVYSPLPVVISFRFYILVSISNVNLLSFFCTPRRKEQRNVSADSVGSITPLLKCKKSGGFFKLGRSSKSKQQSSCLNSRVLRGVMSRKTADNINSVQTGVSRVKIFNASSERYEAPQGRHTVAIPSTADTNQVSLGRTIET